MNLGAADDAAFALQGVVWEAFLTNGEATVYGNNPEMSALSANATEASCCAPAMAPKVVCCE